MLATQALSADWELDVDRGPDWIFVRLRPGHDGLHDDFTLAERIWSLLAQSFTYRLVLELDRVPLLYSNLIAQMVLLSKRIHSHGGLLRLCQLSPENQQVIHVCRLDGCLPHYESRGAAVMGAYRPMQPR
jgi:anti-anti-sigma regulatory factor